MKTALEHFNEFPEPYRSQAIDNAPKWQLNECYETSSLALRKCFFWGYTPQGFDYWDALYYTLTEH